MNRNNQYNLIDVRSKEEFKVSHIPLALNIPLDELENLEWEDFFKQKFKTNIFYSGNTIDAKRAYLLSGYIGDSKKLIYNEKFSTYQKLVDKQASEEQAVDSLVINWRIESNQKLIEKEKFLSKFSAPVKKKVKKIEGGCS